MDPMKKNQKGCYLYNLILYSLSGLACGLICCYPYWFCPLNKFSMKQFLFTHVPYIWSSFCGPKYLFIIANIIIVFLVGESNLMGSSGNSSSSSSSSSSPAAELLYDEYVQISRRVIRDRGAATNFPEKIVEETPQMKVTEQSVKKVHQLKDVFKEKEIKIDEEEEEEEAGLPAEELNKRVEEFIARVNKQRWLEESSLIFCKA